MQVRQLNKEEIAEAACRLVDDNTDYINDTVRSYVEDRDERDKEVELRKERLFADDDELVVLVNITDIHKWGHSDYEDRWGEYHDIEQEVTFRVSISSAGYFALDEEEGIWPELDIPETYFRHYNHNKELQSIYV